MNEKKIKWSPLVETIKNLPPTENCGECPLKDCMGFRCKSVISAWKKWAEKTNNFYLSAYKFNIGMGELCEKVEKDVEDSKKRKEENKEKQKEFDEMIKNMSTGELIKFLKEKKEREEKENKLKSDKIIWF